MNLSMLKRGQVTVFVVIGIIILIILGLVVFYLKSDSFVKEKDVLTTPELEEIKLNIQECLDSSLIDSLRLIGIQGGYFISPESSLETDFANIAYGYDKGKNTLISLSNMQKELSLSLESFFELCFDETIYVEEGYEFEEVKFSTNIKADSVFVSLNYPVKFEKYEIKSFTSSIPIRLGKIYSTAKDLVEIQEKNKEIPDLTYFSNIEFNLKILSSDEDNFVYVITDPNSRIENIPYSFMFAVKLR